MDFYRIKERSTKNGVVEIYPDFRVLRSKDLMIRGKAFYAIWDEKAGLWSTDEYDVQRLVDEDLARYADDVKKRNDGSVNVKFMGDFSSSSWLQFRNFINHLTDNSKQLDEKLTFSNTEIKKEDYVSRRLSYPLAPGDISAYDEIVGTLYEPEERTKIEWAIGAILSGDSKKIHKFLVFYGAPGTGKGTVIELIQKLFEGYYATFEAKTLTGASAFATEAFKSNPLVAIDPDGDMSKIEDNTRLNSIVSHEPMTINEKYKPSYTAKIIAFLIVATNKSIKFTDAKSGLIRRMIDVHPSGAKIAPKRYQALVSQLDFELGAIAHHCLEVYRELGKDYYSGYRPVEMMLQTDVFFNFIEANYDIFRDQDGVTLKQGFDMYKQYCDDALLDFKMPLHKFREELKNYFKNFEERAMVDNVRVRSWYSGFNADRFKVQTNKEDPSVFSLVMDETESIFDKIFMDCPAQYSKKDGSPNKYWTNAPKQKVDPDTGKQYEFIPHDYQVCSTKLSDLDTSREHFVKVPLEHIVIDFDLTGPDGEKSLERNLEAASKWPPTYSELSKSGKGVHLHYIYEGDPTQLVRVYDEGIEIKVFTGDMSLRRRLSKCNNIPIAKINSGLPIQEKKVINSETVKSEKSLRDLIMRNLRKEIHPGTKPSIDFIHKILDDAYYKAELPYDVSDLRSKVLSFANNSSNHALYCIKRVMDMKFVSEKTPDSAPEPNAPKDERPVFFDVEVFPNLFVVCWKYHGSDQVNTMINPTPQAIEDLLNYNLVGFNCRRYDNHILYGRFMGLDNEQLYKLSQRIINGAPNAMYAQAYGLSYTDIYDFASVKMSLKKWEIELGLKHHELGLPWDEPVPEELWDKVAEYCCSDVRATEAVFDDRKEDFIARQILADLSGLSLNHTTQQHTSKIVFGDDKKPQDKFEYTDLSEMFPGYKFELGKSTYRDEETGEGGYVYAEPGMYTDVALLDIASMHPTSIENLNLFGEYTKNFSDLKRARIAIKRGDYEEAKQMLDGKLAKYLNNPEEGEALSYALKIVINIVYGLTSAKFDNSFRDPRNIDNIVAKRGALFMVDLKHAVQDFVGKNGERFSVAHIKTDSIKIPNATTEVIEFVMEFGNKYGYEFEHEATYDRMCLVNDAVYVAKTKPGKKPAYWTATGAQFKEPYVFKTLFSKEPIEFKDLCVTKQVTSSMYLDFNMAEKPVLVGASELSEDIPMVWEKIEADSPTYDPEKLQFVGKTGQFCPMKKGGAQLLREKDGKYHAVTGTKGYLWLESETVKNLHLEDDIDMSYFRKLVDDAVATLGKYGDVEWFLS